MDIFRVLEVFTPIVIIVFSICFWILKQKFVTQNEFEIFKREIDKKINSQEKLLIKLETNLENITNTLQEIKNYLFDKKK